MAVKQKFFILVAMLAFVVSFFSTTGVYALDATWSGDRLVYNNDTYRKIPLPGNDSNFKQSRCNTGGDVYIHVASPGLHALCFVGASTTSAVFVYFPNGRQATLPDGSQTFVFGTGAKDDTSVKVDAKPSDVDNCSSNPDSGNCTGNPADPDGATSTPTTPPSTNGSETETPEEKQVATLYNPDLKCKEGEKCCGDIKVSIITSADICNSDSKEGVIYGLLILVLNILTAAVGIAAVGGIGYGAFLYTTAQNSPEQTKKAISIITNVVIGLVAYALMYVLLNFLIPGGVFA